MCCNKSSSSIDSFVDTTLVSLWFFLLFSPVAIELEAAAVIVRNRGKQALNSLVGRPCLST